ncbi:ACT domain containing protein [Melia azedarach]|uniref:ACT domain containing protein n=1 Tax=Melia azedarach TaxID=155640 RepID=A0ACC1WV67_MELAZ|nr:ACT domain containing protein [Melia azedarach]
MSALYYLGVDSPKKSSSQPPPDPTWHQTLWWVPRILAINPFAFLPNKLVLLSGLSVEQPNSILSISIIFLISMAFIATLFSSSTSSLSLRRSRFLDSDFSPRFSRNSCIFNFSGRFSELGISIASKKKALFASSNGLNAVSSTSLESEPDDSSLPMPVVLIDQDSDSDATIVQLSFLDHSGALLDMIISLNELGLDVSKGTVNTEGVVKHTKLFLTQSTGRKVKDSDLLERIRTTIINSLLKYHLELGESFGIKAPKKLAVDIDTRLRVLPDGPGRSSFYIETEDRPGLLVKITKVIADLNIDVESAEIDTEGLVAKDKFCISYGGAALEAKLCELLLHSCRWRGI